MGGGYRVNAGSVPIINSIIAGNTTGNGPDVSGMFVSAGTTSARSMAARDSPAPTTMPAQSPRLWMRCWASSMTPAARRRARPPGPLELGVTPPVDEGCPETPSPSCMGAEG
ncbi:MAG TPA: hypothetical protein VEL28_10520 [Candidatus Binatia bacterium]|nr:hypothetical protein [Candidatus Binatia bacterium]